MSFILNYWVILIAAVVLGGGAQLYIRSTYSRYAKVPLASGLSGAEVARRMLDANGLQGVGIQQVGGKLTDNYDPRTRVLSLSQDVFQGRSVASAGVASHEAGHAVQHALSYAPAGFRSALVPAANLGSSMAWPLVLAGVFLNFPLLITFGAAFFAIAVMFQVVTLPVEFDASRRAVASLEGVLPSEQVAGARSVLTAAALTYVAAALVSVLYLLYYVSLGRRD
jgi:Zn-dependent membrane protease YugP